MSHPFTVGERVLLLDQRGRTYLITLKEGGQFHFHGGGISHADLLGADEGVTARTPSGAVLAAVRPRLADFAVKMPRGAQVVYPKDIGALMVSTDIAPGHRVLEAGTGSGSLTIALTRQVGSTGAVVSYELRDEHRTKAETNIDSFFGSKPAWLELRAGDVRDVVATGATFDRVVLDLPEPWGVLTTIASAVEPGALVCGYLPTTIQVQDFVLWLRKAGYIQIETLEVMHRTWHVEQRSVRPDHRMVGHTGFLVTGRYIPGGGMPETTQDGGPDGADSTEMLSVSNEQTDDQED